MVGSLSGACRCGSCNHFALVTVVTIVTVVVAVVVVVVVVVVVAADCS